MNFTHVIWDWNGTLLDDLWLSHALTQNQLRRFGIAPISIAEYRDLFSHPVSLFYHRLGFRIPPEEFPALSVEFHEEYRKQRHRCALQPGAREALSYFRSKGVKQCVLSAHEQSILDESLSYFDISPFLECAWGMHNTVGHSKLENGRLLVEQLGVPTESILLIGDTDHDAEVADRLGLHCALVERGYQSDTVLQRTQKPVFKSLVEMTTSLAPIVNSTIR